MINLSKEKNPMPEVKPEVRKRNYKEGATGYTEDMAVREAMRCLRCRTHPCMTKGCPVHNHIPDFIRKITEKDFEGAYQILAETTCLPAVCGRVCNQAEQCEGSCVRGAKGEPVAIGNLERFVADYHRNHVLDAAGSEEKKAGNGKKVAVIGSGPAGIACAGDLADQGFAVTIFEKMLVAGGVLTYGIPEFRLPNGIVEKEIEGLAQKGVRIIYGVSVGEGCSVEDLMKKEGFDAVFIGNGAGVPSTMKIPGEDLDGVCTASDYLVRINLDKGYRSNSANPLPKSKRIAVIGGGNVAMDACRSAIRTGAEHVYVLYRRSEAEMPANAEEIREAMEEGVEFRFLTNPTAVLGDDSGHVKGLTCIRMELGAPDASGRRRPVPIEGSEYTLDVDFCIMAIGTSYDQEFNAGIKDLQLDKWGGVAVDEKTGLTSCKGIYAGGDAVTGPDTVIRAMGAGKKAAAAIAEYLK